jgi:hypothetical protein
MQLSTAAFVRQGHIGLDQVSVHSSASGPGEECTRRELADSVMLHDMPRLRLPEICTFS